MAQLRSEELRIKQKAERKSRRAALREVLEALQKIRSLITDKLLKQDMREKNKREISEGEFTGRGVLEERIQDDALEMLKQNAIEIGGKAGEEITMVANLLKALQTHIDIAKEKSDPKHAERLADFAELTEGRIGDAISAVAREQAEL